MSTFEIPDYLHAQVRETSNNQLLAAERESLWAVRLKLTPIKDGNQWCVLFGDNLQVGIAAFLTK